MSENLHVYLINECEYVAAVDEAQAKEYSLRPGSDYYKHSNADEFEIELADERGYCDDGYNDWTPNRTMIEQARIMVAQGEVPPFHVGVSLDLF